MHVQQAAISAPPIRIDSDTPNVRYSQLVVVDTRIHRVAVWHDLLAFRWSAQSTRLDEPAARSLSDLISGS